MKHFSVFFLFLILTPLCHAQFNETIRTGRPGQAIDPFAVGERVLQAQTGFDIGGFDQDNPIQEGNFSALNTNLRFGITRHFEINSFWEYRGDESQTNSVRSSSTGLSAAIIGTRINLYDGERFPALGLQVSFKLPILAEAYNPDYLAPSIMLIASQALTNQISLLVNTGVNYDGNNAEPTGVYVINLSYSISDKWGAFIENYGDYSDNGWNNKWDTGLSYLVHNNLQLDIYGGIGNNHGVFDYFTSIGLSWRTLNWRKSGS